MINFDIIGDIHGHANELKLLLKKMKYKHDKGYYNHISRKVIFIGDYIDRGPASGEVYQIVRSMVENNQAIALMGNHEYNAVCLNTKNTKTNEFLRPHTIENLKQYNKTKVDCEHKSAYFEPDKYDTLEEEMLAWFKKLPLFYENENFRAVHACWDSAAISQIKNKLNGNYFVNNEQLELSVNKQSDLFKLIEIVLKGKEVKLPNNMTFFDNDNIIRDKVRIKWWFDKSEIRTWNDLSVHPLNDLKNKVLTDDFLVTLGVNSYNEEKIVFFGHYWMQENKPYVFNDYLTCVDFSVAKNNILVAYRYNGEKKLINDNFVYVVSSN